jgi:rRNA maturation protein Nop10
VTLTKAGKTLKIVDGGLTGRGRIIQMCKCPTCMSTERHNRFSLLPCGCAHAMILACSCKLRDEKCQKCGRVFVSAGGDWYEIEDPHPKVGGKDRKHGR